MKRNAIIRIILFSITIVVLLAILVVGIFGGRIRRFFRPSTEISSLPLAIDGNQTTGAVSAKDIHEIEIEWLSGTIIIQPDENINDIRFSENTVSDAEYQMFYKTSGSKLTIQFSENGNWDSAFGISINSTVKKDLVIYVPVDWTCASLEIDAASATLQVNDLTIKEVEVDTASGTCGFENCNVGTLDIDTASGDVVFTGTLDVLECDSASAAITANLTNIPTRIEVDTMSGDLDITLPENAGFIASIDAMSSDFTSDFATTKSNGAYVCGDGACRINVSAMSGDVAIRRNPTSAAVTTPEEIQP